MKIVLHSTISLGKQMTQTENLGSLHWLLCYSIPVSRIPVRAELLPRVCYVTYVWQC